MDASAAVGFCAIPLSARYFRVGRPATRSRNFPVSRRELKNAALLQVHVVSGGLCARDGGFVTQAPLAQKLSEQLPALCAIPLGLETALQFANRGVGRATLVHEANVTPLDAPVRRTGPGR